MKILIVFGTRPEAIKMAPLVKVFQESPFLDTRVCVTAQHRQMLDQVIEFFNIKAHYDLDLMRPGQDLYGLSSNIIDKMKPVLEDFNPDFVFVHGDTTTSTLVALASFYHRAKICHVEAGLRTFNKNSPFPEEMNRQLTARLADLHFAPTEGARQNLLAEGVCHDRVFVTGNTVIDALFLALNEVDDHSSSEIDMLKSIVMPGKKIILVTGHRRENFGKGFLDICEALRKLSKDDDFQIIFPVHLNPHVQEPVYSILGDLSNVNLISPLSYPAFVWLMRECYLILTDSGGVQEEAPSLGKPVLVMRDTTERPEAMEAGTVLLVGTDQDKIVSTVNDLLDAGVYSKMANAHNPYGDGLASKRILEFLTLTF